MPPIRLLSALPVMRTPSQVAQGTTVPVTSVPMRLPCTLFPVVPAEWITTPQTLCPEITLPAPAAAPPTTLPLAPPEMLIPVPALPRTAVPVTSVPMKLP